MPRLELIFLRFASGDGFDALRLLSVMRDWWTGYVCKDRFSLAHAVMKPPVFWSSRNRGQKASNDYRWSGAGRGGSAILSVENIRQPLCTMLHKRIGIWKAGLRSVP